MSVQFVYLRHRGNQFTQQKIQAANFVALYLSVNLGTSAKEEGYVFLSYMPPQGNKTLKDYLGNICKVSSWEMMYAKIMFLQHYLLDFENNKKVQSFTNTAQKKISFLLRISSVNVAKSQETADLVTFTE